MLFNNVCNGPIQNGGLNHIWVLTFNMAANAMILEFQYWVRITASTLRWLTVTKQKRLNQALYITLYMSNRENYNSGINYEEFLSKIKALSQFQTHLKISKLNPPLYLLVDISKPIRCVSLIPCVYLPQQKIYIENDLIIFILLSTKCAITKNINDIWSSVILHKL